VYLHKFCQFNEFTNSIFENSEIFFQAVNKFNDPFECQPAFNFERTDKQILNSLCRHLTSKEPLLSIESIEKKAEEILRLGFHNSDEAWKKMAKDLIDKIQNTVGVFCMSSKKDNILMWSHYADDHKGFCLIFEASDTTPFFGNAQEVSYSDEYPLVEWFDTSQDRQIQKVFLTKYSDWKYESEWRIVDHENGAGVQQFPEHLLIGVIFGLKMDDKEKNKIVNWSINRSNPLKFYQATQSKHAYKIDMEPINT
jgi:hypothetical protein